MLSKLRTMQKGQLHHSAGALPTPSIQDPVQRVTYVWGAVLAHPSQSCRVAIQASATKRRQLMRLHIQCADCP